MHTILNYKDQISLCANIITILAFILAIIAFFNWRREQKHAKKLDYIMDLEDKLEILMHNIKMEFKWFSDMERNLIDTDNKSSEYKKQLNDFIKDEFQKYKNEQTLEKDFYEYSLALVRVKRFLKNIDEECKVLNYISLKELSEEAITLKPKWINEDTISNESKKYLEKINEMHKEGLACIQKKYK